MPSLTVDHHHVAVNVMFDLVKLLTNESFHDMLTA